MREGEKKGRVGSKEGTRKRGMEGEEEKEGRAENGGNVEEREGGGEKRGCKR